MTVLREPVHTEVSLRNKALNAETQAADPHLRSREKGHVLGASPRVRPHVQRGCVLPGASANWEAKVNSLTGKN